MNKTKIADTNKNSHQQVIDLLQNSNYNAFASNQALFDKLNQINQSESSKKHSLKSNSGLTGPKKEVVFYANAQQQIDYGNLVNVSNKLADSHAASILMNSLNAKLNTSSSSSLSSKFMSNNNNLNAIAFSKPIAQSLNFNALLKSDSENKKSTLTNDDQSKVSISNRLIELPSGSNKSSTFNLSQSLTDNSAIIPTTQNKLKEANKSTTVVTNQMNRSAKSVLNDYDKRNYRASLKNFYDLNLKSAQSTVILANNHRGSSVITATAATSRNQASKDIKNSRAITVKLFAANQFKMNLPPINKYKLFNNLDKKISSSRGAMDANGGSMIVAGENNSFNKQGFNSNTPNLTSRLSNNRPMIATTANNTKNNHKSNYISNNNDNNSNNRHEKRTMSGCFVKKNLVDNLNSSRTESHDAPFDQSTNDELRFQIDKLCKISFNSKSKNGQNWSDNDSLFFSDEYFFNNPTTKSIMLKNSSSANNNKFEENYILIDSDNRSEFNYASLDEDETNDLYNDNNIGETVEDEGKGFSDDELDDMTLKEKRTESLCSRKSLSKSMSRDASVDSNCESLCSVNEEDYLSDDQSESGESLADILSKHGYDYKSLFTSLSKRLENGDLIKYKPPLIISQFDYVPPTINFISSDQKLTEMPEKLHKLLRWKMCSITPNIVKSTIARSNFKLANQKNDWIGIWGSHMKPEAFRVIKEYQKINHFPGSFQIGRKDRLCKNLSHAQSAYGKGDYNFVPLTFVLPHDYLLLKSEMESRANSKWILKPPASARGQGIRLVNKMDQVPKKRACVVQKYLSNPYLIDNLKFDLRIYVYVTSYDPLRVYIFNDGLTRFASRKYSNSSKTIHDKFMHLTNYSINKTNKEYKSNNDENACYGHKWSLKALWVYLRKKGINTDKIWDNITDLVVKTIICGDPHVNLAVKTHVKRKYSVHELFGFDVILDETLKPWIVEVNISPSLNSSSPLDVTVKGQMIADLFNLAGYMLPDPKMMARIEGKKHYIKVPKPLVFNKAILPQSLSNDEKMKHNYYSQRHTDERALSTLFDVITPDDLRILIETEDEYARRGNFIRIFPSSNSKNYMKYFEIPRYYNILVTEWVDKYKRNRDKGISLLNYYCKKKVHFQNPAISIENQWTQHKTYKYLENSATIRSKSFVGYQNNDTNTNTNREVVA